MSEAELKCVRPLPWTWDCMLGERSVRDSLKWLREHYLLYRREHGSNVGKSNYADRYQLIVPTDWRGRYGLQGFEDDDGTWEPWHPPKKKQQ